MFLREWSPLCALKSGNSFWATTAGIPLMPLEQTRESRKCKLILCCNFWVSFILRRCPLLIIMLCFIQGWLFPHEATMEVHQSRSRETFLFNSGSQGPHRLVPPQAFSLQPFNNAVHSTLLNNIFDTVSWSDKDVLRTDRTHPYYKGDNNPNISMLYDILMTYCMYNFDLGESDHLCIPEAALSWLGLPSTIISCLHRVRSGYEWPVSTYSSGHGEWGGCFLVSCWLHGARGRSFISIPIMVISPTGMHACSSIGLHALCFLCRVTILRWVKRGSRANCTKWTCCWD